MCIRDSVKTERLTDSAINADAKAFTNYHIKTLMLWACELKPRSRWTDDLNVVRICVELLHTLAVWLNDGRCANYFVNNCNLLDYDDNSHDTRCIARKLVSVTEPWLAEWFINNYVRKCAQICGEPVARFFDDVSTMTKPQNAVSEVVDWRLRTSHVVLDTDVQEPVILIVIERLVSDASVTVRSRLCWMRILTQIDQRLCFHFIAMTFLHVARKTTEESLTDELLDLSLIHI